DLRGGRSVAQGDLVGAVGMTGLATGPHLDYRTIRNGAFVNPLTIQPPPAEPVPSSARAAFEAARDQELALLEPAGAVVADDTPGPRRSLHDWPAQGPGRTLGSAGFSVAIRP